jgi:hypothetical protein
MDVPTAREMNEITQACLKLASAHSQRSPTSKFATLGELDALMNLKVLLRALEEVGKVRRDLDDRESARNL